MAIVFKVQPWYAKSGGIDYYFDPVTHTATKEKFLEFLDAGIYTTDVIGYKVNFGGKLGTCIIADLNHDSEHTLQTDCYDLIMENLDNSEMLFGSYAYYYSNVRSYLNDTSSIGFYGKISSDVKSRMLKIKYYSRNAWWNDDYVIAPSRTELNFPQLAVWVTEGIPYPIFTDNASRIKYRSGNAKKWWTRSVTAEEEYVCRINENGSMSSVEVEGNYSAYTSALIRMH